MKCLSVFLLLLSVSSSFASENFFCGTKNQWHTEDQSGWFIEFFINDSSAFVTKSESSKVTRQYGYALKEFGKSAALLSSPYGDTIDLVRTTGGYDALFKDKSSEESFSLLCFNSNVVKKIDSSKEISRLNLEVSQMAGLSYYLQDKRVELPFALLAQRIQQSISEIGDWEDTILNEEQNLKVMATLLKMDEFNSFLTLIEKDIERNAPLKKIGLLFGRDWYSGDGVVAVVLKYKNEILVAPFSFPGGTVFGDERLDYVY